MRTKQHYKQELLPPTLPLVLGATGTGVRRLQEWLYIWNYYEGSYNYKIVVDGIYGIATQIAVTAFQRMQGLVATGICGNPTWSELVQPMRNFYIPTTFHPYVNLAKRLIVFADEALVHAPREIPPNRGPWIRAIMDGNDGAPWAWCAGMMMTLLDLGLDSLGKKLTEYITPTFSCNQMRDAAISKDALVLNSAWVKNTSSVQPGDMFLLLASGDTDYAHHVGLVEEVHPSHIITYEGNTNDEGSREGIEFCKRIRNPSTSRIEFIQTMKYIQV